MLGRLATWLRLLGYDATYGSHLSGRALLRHARTEGRVILTRDSKLLKQLDRPPVLFVRSDHFREQLREVATAYPIVPVTRLLTRCARCNEAVVTVSKPLVEDRVPPYVYATQEHFVECPRCHRLYWPATHEERVRDELRQMGFDVAAPLEVQQEL